MMKNKLFTIGILGAIAVSLGALGAHALKNQIPTGKITPDLLHGFETGVTYHMYHTLAMFGIFILSQTQPGKFLNYAYHFFFWGIICFSGSLYLLCTRNIFNADFLKFLGPVTPVGGVLFIAGWVCLGLSFYNKMSKENKS
jgi:uncharacterized membrane protein YgdD (TMEM256/DUF423 family)